MPFLLEKPAQPTLTVSDNDPNSGDPFVLTCDSTTATVTSYQFKKDGDVIATVQAPNPDTDPATHGIDPASINDKGVYTCCALIDAVSSDDSSSQSVAGSFIQIK